MNLNLDAIGSYSGIGANTNLGAGFGGGSGIGLVSKLANAPTIQGLLEAALEQEEAAFYKVLVTSLVAITLVLV